MSGNTCVTDIEMGEVEVMDLKTPSIAPLLIDTALLIIRGRDDVLNMLP